MKTSRKFSFYLRVLILLYSFIVQTSTNAQEMISTPIPKWVVDRQIDTANFLSEDDEAGSLQYFLEDQQTLYDENGPTVFANQIVKLRTIQAIEEAGTVQIQYNPAYQSYAIHHLKIWRDGESIDVLPNVRVTQNSYNSESNTPDHEGANVLQLFISDLRRNDVIDFAHSITGQNTAYGNRTIGFNFAIAAIDVNNVYRRFLISKDRNLTFQYNGGHKLPSITEENDHKIYEWNWDSIKQTVAEASVPIWYPAYPIVSFSDFNDWGDVESWATDLFSFEGESSSTVSEMAGQIIQDAVTQEDKLLAIFSFMQSEIRYVGLEIGRNGYRPFKPSLVLERRYGDCKDQTVLLRSLLKAVGIDAWSALVNSQSGKVINNYGYSPISFDHAIVKAKIGNYIYWLDPTISLPKDEKADLTPPRYEKALVLGDGMTELSDIPLMEKDPFTAQILVEDHYDFGDNLTDVLNWKRDSTYSGATADFVKKTVDNIGVRQLNTTLRQSHQSLHKEMENNEFSTVEDLGNLYTIHEDYKVAQAGVYDENKDRTEFGFAPLNIAELMRLPKSISDRRAPFFLSFPVRRRSIVNIDMPKARFEPFRKQISNAYMTYQSYGNYIEDKFQISYSFETHKDHVPIEDLEKYSNDINLIISEMFFYIYSYDIDGTQQIIVYQPILNEQNQMKGQASLNVYEKLDSFLNTSGLEYLEESREEVLDILQSDGMTTQLSDKLLRTILYYAIAESKTDEAYFYHDIHVKSDGKIPRDLILSLVQHFVQHDEYEMAIDVLEKEINDSSWPQNSSAGEVLYSAIREVYWVQKDYINLATTLEHLIKFFPKQQHYFRELAVVFDILEKSKKAQNVRDEMAEMGYSDLEIKTSDDQEDHNRIPRPLVRTAPFYPQNAAERGIEGYAIAEFTVLESGETQDCRVVESSPENYFEQAACDAVDKFFYYPIEENEINGDVNNVKTRLDFTLEN